LTMTRVQPNLILFVCPTCSPIGGLQTWLDAVCSGLEKRGWQPIVALVHGPTTHDSVAYKAAHPDLDTLTIDGTAMTMAARVRAVKRTIQDVNPEFYIPLTVIDAHDAVCALKLENRFKGCYVLSLHGNLPEQILDASLYQPFADISVNPGALTCKLMQRVGMPPERIFHVPNGCYTHKALRTIRDYSKPIRLAYVGRLTDADKRVMDMVGLIEALEKTGINYLIDIVGSGPCEGALRKNISSEKVSFFGFIEPTILHEKYFKNWDVLLLFSQSEAFGISLIEAMMHGVVPVSSRFVGHRAEGFLKDRETALLFDIGDMEACAQGVRCLSEDRTLLKKLAEQGREYVQTNYSWERCIDGWERALNQARSLSRRDVPILPPRPLDEGNSLAVRFPWLPVILSDAYYKLKWRVLGVPNSMRHGEEWPMHTNCFDNDALREMEALTAQMDRSFANKSVSKQGG